ncbi:MAG: hypothetical protein RBS35_07710, partial [Azonexus sp.]|nr:hypothetical protein [Azonexus sp.]
GREHLIVEGETAIQVIRSANDGPTTATRTTPAQHLTPSMAGQTELLSVMDSAARLVGSEILR